MHLAQSFSGSKKGATACVLMLAAMLAFFTLAPQNALAAAYTWTGGTVPTVANGDSVTIAPTASGAGPSGTLNVPAAATITIDGTVTGSTNGITLNVPADATVIWTATLHGARPGSKLVTLTGGGTLNVYGGLIVNVGSTSASGALAVTGDGCTVNVAQGGIVTSDSSGTAILISANNVTVNVNGSGTVQSLKSDPTTTSTGSALQIGGSATLTGTQVNVNGGSVIADYGYAINDGAGANVIAGQNSIITISGATALVQSQTACAIHSTGSDTQVTVSGGMVTNNASSNANPTINMLGDGEAQGSFNVVISGGVVQNTNTASTAYSIQTLGNLQVTGGTITTANGRGINLAGSSSNATVSGGLIQATGSGVALCTATTTIPPNTSITMSGGTISANSSYAIEITGANSTLSMTGGTVQSVTSDAIYAAGTGNVQSVSVLGGAVISTSGRGIYMQGTGSITVGGGSPGTPLTDPTTPVMGAQVMSTSSEAIQTYSSAASVTIQSNCQVYNLNTANPAILMPSSTPASNYSQTGGFVFSYGASTSSVVTPNQTSVAGGLIVAWNEAAGIIMYPQLNYTTNPSYSQNDLTIVSNAVDPSYYFGWNNDPQHGGSILYYDSDYADAAGLFYLSAVRIQSGNGLVFDCSSGNMYLDMSYEGTLVAGKYQLYTEGQGVGNLWWSTGNASTGYNLVLNGFGWQTQAPLALSIINSHMGLNNSCTITVNPGKNNVFISADADLTGDYLVPDAPLYAGISSSGPGAGLYVYGGGTLVARAGGPTGTPSYGITGKGTFTLQSGDITAGGNSSAYQFPNVAQVYPNVPYTWWNTEAIANNGGHNGIFTPDGTCMHTCHSGPGSTFLSVNSQATPYNLPYVIDSHMSTLLQTAGVDCYVRIQTSNVVWAPATTISGTMNEVLPNMSSGLSPRITVNPVGYSVTSFTNIDATSWFSNLPEGVTVAASSNVSGANPTITFRFSGTPLDGFNGAMEISIPGNYLGLGASSGSVDVFPNPNALFAIDPVYFFIVSNGVGGTVTGDPTAQYKQGTPLQVQAVPNEGYYFDRWDILESVLPVAPMPGLVTPAATAGLLASTKTNPYSVTMPANRHIVTAYFTQTPPPAPVPPSPNPGPAPALPVTPRPATPPQSPSRLPHTGDPFALGALLLLMLGSAATVAGLVRYKKATDDKVADE